VIDVTVSTQVNRPIDEVFSFVAAMENEPKWHTDVLEAEQLTEGEVGQGTKYRFQLRPSPMAPPGGTAEIIAFEPSHRIVMQADMGKMKPTMTHVFEEEDGWHPRHRRTQVESLSGPMALMSPLIRSMMRRRNVGFLGNLKQVLET
jgi:uncharacterized protein YndB with AHSA1/START domain